MLIIRKNLASLQIELLIKTRNCTCKNNYERVKTMTDGDLL